MSNTTANESQAPETVQNPEALSPLRALVESLTREPEAPPVEKQAAARGKAVPKDIHALAETLGVEVADLYSVAVPSSREGVEPYTLGKLKDFAANQDAFTVRSLQLDEDRRKLEAAGVRREAELSALLRALPPEAVKPEVRAAIEKRRADALDAERAETLKAIPAWQDEALRSSEVKAMVEFAKNYGLSESYFANNYDHRMIRMLRDFTLQSQRLQAALAQVKELRTPTPGRSKVTTVQARGARPAVRPPTREDQRMSSFLNALK